FVVINNLQRPKIKLANVSRSQRIFSAALAAFQRPHETFVFFHKKTSSHAEKRSKIRTLFSFSPDIMPGLDLAPGHPKRIPGRLPWCHRASPSTTLHETVISTDADRLI